MRKSLVNMKQTMDSNGDRRHQPGPTPPLEPEQTISVSHWAIQGNPLQRNTLQADQAMDC